MVPNSEVRIQMQTIFSLNVVMCRAKWLLKMILGEFLMDCKLIDLTTWDKNEPKWRFWTEWEQNDSVSYVFAGLPSNGFSFTPTSKCNSAENWKHYSNDGYLWSLNYYLWHFAIVRHDRNELHFLICAHHFCRCQMPPTQRARNKLRRQRWVREAWARATRFIYSQYNSMKKINIWLHIERIRIIDTLKREPRLDYENTFFNAQNKLCTVQNGNTHTHRLSVLQRAKNKK